MSKTKTNLNTVASDLSTKSKELSDEITGVKQNITGLTSTVNNNAGNISQLQQRATDIETTVADNNKKLSSQITQNANSISTVVANLNNTDLANSPYRSITQLKQTTDSISSVVSANKIAQDNVNSSLTSKINQTANSISSTVSAVVANLNSTNLANSPYKSITALKQTTDSISSTVSTNKNSTDEAISQVSQKADTIKATIEGNLNSTDTSKSPYKAVTQLQANINGVSSVVSANKSSTDSEISKIKQTANSISSTVSANKSAQDSVNSSLTSKIQQNANSVTSIIANLSDVDKAKKNYSAISQLQDDINLRVAKGDVISQINLDKTGATIDGKLLHVTGDTVIEKNVIAKGMIQAGAVTADNLAAETINLTDKLKIQGNNVTLDENGLSVDMQNEGKINFGSGGMTVSDSSGNLYSAIRRVCMGMAKNGNYIAFDPPWEVEPSVLVFPQTIVTADTSRSNTVQRLHCYADEISKNGFRIHVYEGIDTTDYTIPVNKVVLDKTEKVSHGMHTVGPWDANFSFNIPSNAKEINLVMTISGEARYKNKDYLGWGLTVYPPCITINGESGTASLTVYANSTLIYSNSNFITDFSVNGWESVKRGYQTGPLKINNQTNIHGTLRIKPGVSHAPSGSDDIRLSVSVDYAQGYRDTGSASSIIDSDCNALFFATDKVSSGYRVL